MKKLEIIYKSESELFPYANNTRTHSKEQIEKLKSSITEFGMATPIGVHNQTIVYGHARFLALKQLGYEEFPTVDLSYMSEAQMKAYIIADNRLGLDAGWDDELLKVELEALAEMDFNLDLVGFDADELEELDLNLDGIDTVLDEDKADEVPEVEENPIIKLGDLIELGHNYQHRVLCGDSTSEDDVSKLMDGAKADMVFTDPPYNLDYGSSNNPKHKQRENYVANDKMSDEDWNIFTNNYIKNLIENVNGNLYIFMSEKELGHLQQSFKKNDGIFGSFIVWVKDRLIMSGKDYHTKHETCLYGWTKKTTSRQRVENRKETDVWEINRPSTSKLHPTMKPVELVERAIFNSSKAKQIVLDLFLGSGSTLIASENLSRKCYGMELDEKYAQVIVQRYVDYTSNPKIKINGVEVDWYEYKEKLE